MHQGRFHRNRPHASKKKKTNKTKTEKYFWKQVLLSLGESCSIVGLQKFIKRQYTLVEISSNQLLNRLRLAAKKGVVKKRLVR